MNRLKVQDVNRLDELTHEMHACRKCHSVDHRFIYPGRYKTGQKYFFVGASPYTPQGREEAFRTGAAATNFNMFLSAAGIDREECYVTNAVVHIPMSKGKPRASNENEKYNCSFYLKTQIDIIDPKVVVALGVDALVALDLIDVVEQRSVTRALGKEYNWYNRTLLVLTHPSPNAVAIRGDTYQIQDYKFVKEVTERKYGE